MKALVGWEGGNEHKVFYKTMRNQIYLIIERIGRKVLVYFKAILHP
jgi:hypothetical protein